MPLVLAALWASPAAGRRQAPLPEPTRVQNIGLRAAALRPVFLAKHRPSYRVTVPLAAQAGTIRDQKSSSRCWLFAATSVLSNKVQARSGRRAPELSVSFLNHHSLRRQAHGLIDQAVVAEKPVTSKVDEIGEGGEFPYAMQLVREHGLVPEAVMPSRTADADSSAVLLSQVRRLVTAATVEIGGIDKTQGDRRARVAADYKQRVVRLLDLSLGKPPERFEVHGRRHSPASYRRALGLADRDLRYVSLFNRPNKSEDPIKVEDKTGGFASFSARQVKSRQMRKLAKQALDAGEALYFAANVSSDNPHRVEDKRVSDEKKGILSVSAFDYRGLVPVTPIGKRDRLTAGIDKANHGMVLTGYDTRGKSDTVRKWQVHNSWGADNGDRGRLHMYNDYFGAYVEKLYVPQHLVPESLR